MFKTYSIASDDNRYVLSALITNKGFEMPSLIENPCENNYLTSEYFIADCEDWLINTFYPKIKECVEDDDYSNFDEWYNENTYFGELCDMFEEAIKVGFFKNFI